MCASVAMVSAAAFGGLCDTITPGTDSSCRAYDFKASVKLVDGKKAKVDADSICADDGIAYYRVSATRKVKGVFFDCDTCNATNSNVKGEAFLFGGDQGAGGDFAHLYISTSASKYKVVSHTSDDFSDKYGSGAYNGSAVYDFKILNFFGAASEKKAKKAEALIALDFVEFDQYSEFRPWSILCAGFGAQENGLVKNLSGNLAGAVAAATWCGIPTVVFEPCLLDPSYTGLSITQDPVTISFTPDACIPWSAILVDGTASWSTDAVCGTWSLKYNKSESKAAYGSTVLNKVFAKGWTYTDGKPGYTTGWAAPLIVQKVQ
ncbi:MAG: hypothetical protein IJU44_12960 [Kiritimatiellae bacterium]|nr:hypothetical protein [Kiritimatiellia bacterium]